MDTRWIGLALMLGSVGCASARPAPSSVARAERPGLRVYVGTAVTGNDADRRGLTQSVEDVRSTFAHRHGRVRLVDSPAQADVTVAVVERVIEDSKSSLSLIPPRYYPPRSITRLRVTVTRAGESADLVGTRWRNDNAEGRASAARDVVAAIDAWLATSARPDS